MEVSARGLERETSDIDLFVISDDKDFAGGRIAKANSETLSRFGFAISPLIFSKKEFLRGKNKPLEKSIIESYHMICGQDLSELLSSVKKNR